MEAREPLGYLKDLLEDITHAIEEEDSTAVHNPSDIVNLKHAIEKFKDMQNKLENGFADIASMDCKHETIVLANRMGKKSETGGWFEVEFIVRCHDCEEELFCISEYGREIVNNSKH